MNERDGAQVATLAAALRADADDLSLYAGFLLHSLADALPAELVTVDHTRSLTQRLRGEEGAVTGVHLRLGDEVFNLVRPNVGAAGIASVTHEVNGIRLSSETVGLDSWSLRVAAALLNRAAADSGAAAVLADLLHPGGTAPG